MRHGECVCVSFDKKSYAGGSPAPSPPLLLLRFCKHSINTTLVCLYPCCIICRFSKSMQISLVHVYYPFTPRASSIFSNYCVRETVDSLDLYFQFVYHLFCSFSGMIRRWSWDYLCFKSHRRNSYHQGKT